MQHIAVITGGGTGIGRAIALALAALGDRVVIVGRRQAPLKQTAAIYPDLIDYVPVDITTSEGCQAIANALPDDAEISVLIHNAGMIQPTGPLMQVDTATYQQALNVNVLAPLMLTQTLLRRFSPQARMLFMSSGAAHFSIPGIRAYSSTKAALYNLFLGMKDELAGRIAVGSLKPGIVDTPMQATMREHGNLHAPNLQVFQEMQADLVSPQQVARFVVYLLKQVDAEVFSAEEWDIYDLSHQAAWAEGDVIELPPSAAS